MFSHFRYSEFFENQELRECRREIVDVVDPKPAQVHAEYLAVGNSNNADAHTAARYAVLADMRSFKTGGSWTGSAQHSAMSIEAARSGSSITSPTLIDETSIPFRSAASLRVSRTLTIRARKKLAPMVFAGKMFVYRHVVTGDTLQVSRLRRGRAT